ncbi:MAG: hypothetical protein D6814_15345 [Calditrichaeota bacterium]|nr:MAG: hypothetical protein D6814_15345 [Calditrichota bacterium]
MLGQPEMGRGEAIFVVAGFATAAVLPVGKLPGVDVLVAIPAVGKFQLATQVTAGMAFFAGDLRMQPAQWEAGQRMIEGSGIHLHPAGGVVTFLTIFPKPAAMRVFVAIGAGVEFQAGKFCEKTFLVFRCFAVAHIRVAFSAGHAHMFAGQAEARAVVIEFRYRFPGLLGMALQAIAPQLPAMFVEMAAFARFAQSQKGFAEIDFLLQLAQVVPNEFGLVALPALQGAVFATQHIARGLMIKLPHPAVGPGNQLEVATRMLAMTIDAGLLLLGDHGKVIPAFGTQPHLYLLVAIQTFGIAEFRSQFMALQAFGHAIQEGMGFG